MPAFSCARTRGRATSSVAWNTKWRRRPCLMPAQSCKLSSNGDIHARAQPCPPARCASCGARCMDFARARPEVAGMKRRSALAGLVAAVLVPGLARAQTTSYALRDDVREFIDAAAAGYGFDRGWLLSVLAQARYNETAERLT